MTSLSVLASVIYGRGLSLLPQRGLRKEPSPSSNPTNQENSLNFCLAIIVILWGTCACGSGVVLRVTTSVTAVDRITLGIDTIRVWVPDTMWAEPFHDSPITAPVCRPLPHVMVRGVMDDAGLSLTLTLEMDRAYTLPCAGGVVSGHDACTPVPSGVRTHVRALLTIIFSSTARCKSRPSEAAI